jgi:hypothetical protein
LPEFCPSYVDSWQPIGQLAAGIVARLALGGVA